MSYLVLARKWRPMSFEDVVGQRHVTKTLVNAIESDRVAHAFVFSGVRGVGKTSLARILAKALNCVDGPTSQPCGDCESCRAVTAGTAVDVIEIDGASNNSVDDIRDLRETIPYRPALGKFKIYVIDEVHMLSTSAFNALLKTLEEPPPHVKFIFATTEPHKIPVTILSRCQRYDFRRIPTSAIVERILTILNAEKIDCEKGALELIGREAEGSMRDALSILDQVLAAGSEKITADSTAELLGIVERQVLYDISRTILNSDPRGCLDIVHRVDDRGYDIPTFAKGLLEHFRNLVIAGVCQGDKSVLDLPDGEASELVEQAAGVSKETLHRLFKHFAQSYETIARSSHPKIMLETSLARLADLGELVSAADLVKRLETLAATNPGGDGGSGPRGPGGMTPEGSRTLSAVRTKKIDVAPAKRQTPSEAPVSTQISRETNISQAAPVAEKTTPVPASQVVNTTDNWEEALEWFKRDKPSAKSIIECGHQEFDSGSGELKLKFSGDYSAVSAMARERSQEIAQCLSVSMKRTISVVVAIDDGVSIPVATRQRLEREDQARRLEEEARQQPLVRLAQSEFGGTITRVQIIDRDKSN
jgi:DNA polymerase III subunit gamma/tau